MELKTDCMYYTGEKPCRHARMCDGCDLYRPWRSTVLVIKTMAMGDVLRTTSILPAIHDRYPDCRITWVARAASRPLLEHNPYIHELLTLEDAVVPSLAPRRFDTLLSLDKTTSECGLAMMVSAGVKKGIGLSESGTPFPLDTDADYYFSLGLSDELKFKTNEKTYGELISRVCGLGSERRRPILHLTDIEKKAGERLVRERGAPGSRRIVYIAPSAGAVFANKTPSAAKWKDIIEKIREDAGDEEIAFLLLGGRADSDKVRAVSDLAGGLPYIITEDVRVFAACVGQASVLLCGDTLALHIATALGIRAAVLFGPTCHAEIDLYDKGEKIITSADCAPCYLGHCDISPNCMDVIKPGDVAAAVRRLLAD